MIKQSSFFFGHIEDKQEIHAGLNHFFFIYCEQVQYVRIAALSTILKLQKMINYAVLKKLLLIITLKEWWF